MIVRPHPFCRHALPPDLQPLQAIVRKALGGAAPQMIWQPLRWPGSGL